MSNHKWEIGPVKLVNGWDAVIHRFCEKRRKYIGELQDDSGSWFAREWFDSGLYSLADMGHEYNLAPPPKKTVRVQRYVNVFDDGCMVSWPTREEADGCKDGTRFACIEIDREVEEGEGLDPNVRSDAASMRRAKQ